MDVIHTAKDILDKYLPMVIRKDKVFLREGEAQVNNHDQEKYSPENYSEDIVLQVAPKDAIVMEYEDTPEKNKRYIAESEEACRVLGLQYCVTSHGGKSDYLRIYNIKGLPPNYDNKIAKNLLIEMILSPGAKEQLDRTNLGWTLSPVIGHPHWKPKYNGTIHQIIRGTHPLDQKNEYQKDLLKKIDKAKKQTKFGATEILKNNQWVNEFLLKYCTSNVLPGGNRHHTIEKNLAALVFHRADRDSIIEQYLNMQGRKTDTTKTWMNAIANGQYSEVSVLEIKRYINDNNIPFNTPKKIEEKKKDVPIPNDSIEILKDKKLLFNLVSQIHDIGVVGEENTILILINKVSLRLVPGHKATSSNVVVSDVSGAGKDAITGAVMKVMVPEDKLIHRTRFSDKALEYMMIGREDETLDGTVFYLEDPEDDMIKSQAFRVMASGQNKATVVKDQEILELSVKGKPVIVVTSMNTTIDLEGERRWDAVSTDTSEILTRLVMKEKLRIGKEGSIHIQEKPPIVKAIQSLKPCEVLIPYADKLYPYFEKSPSLIMRTQIDKFLDYIKASAVLHQYQREKNSKGQIIANDFDYLYSKYIFSVLGDAEGGMLNSIERKMIEILKQRGEPITISELATIKGFPRSADWLYKHHEDLKARHIVGETSTWNDKANKLVTKIYCDIGISALTLPEGSVLFGFIGGCENQNQRGFIGFIGFINILKELNENRVKMGLLPLIFDEIDKKQKNISQSLENSENRENLSVGTVSNTEENLIIPNKTTGVEQEEVFTPSGVHEYIKKVEDGFGKGLTIDLLMDKFPDQLIMDLVNQCFLIPVHDDSGFKKYTWDENKACL